MSVLFVTQEFEGMTPGGAGALVARLVAELARQGRESRVLLVMEEPPTHWLPDVTLVVVDPERDGPLEDSRARFLARSRAAARGITDLMAAGGVERVEFTDFDGLGFWALTHRPECGIEAVGCTVRFHGPVDLMWEATGSGHAEWETVRAMERGVFACADAVVVPAEAWVTPVASRYGLDVERVVVGAPDVPALSAVRRAPASTPEFVCVGRLGEVKGSHDLVDAAVTVLARHPDARFRFIGPDGWSATAGKPMSEWLAERIPEDLRPRILFEGSVPRDELPDLLGTAWAAVVPSRFESFCLVAHELRRAGLPVVVPDLPPFEDFDAETGALRFDGSVAGLANALDALITDQALGDRLAVAPPPRLGDPLTPYHQPVAVRHPRVQAGLATAAMKALEETIPPQPEPGARRAAKAALRLLPDPVARAAVRLLPQTVKDRFRAVASWPEEAARREQAARRDALLQRIRAGEFPELDSPRTSVVIPCFNQGHFLEEALLSVFAQTDPSWEIIVVDDGSDDPDTVAVLDALSLPRTTLIRQDNRGLPGARNAGMRRARGRFLVPLDADDELAPTFLERLGEELERCPDAAYAQCWSELFGDQSAIWVNRPFNPYQMLLSNSVVGCVLLRRDAWAAVGGYAEDMTEGNEDWDLWLKLLEAGWDQVEVHEPLFRYRKHGVSMSVETEARFEQARSRMPARHPDLYARAESMKREWFPWISVVCRSQDPSDLMVQTLHDVEVVPLEGTILVERPDWKVHAPARDARHAVSLARGRVVVDWSAVRSAAPDFLERIAAATDATPLADAVVVDGVAVAWRRARLVQGPDVPPRIIDCPLDATVEGPSIVSPWVGPDAADEAAEALGGLDVHRQREELGALPAWLSGDAS